MSLPSVNETIMESEHEVEVKKYCCPRRLPTGMRRVETADGVRTEIDPAKADGLRLALALAETGKVSVREISVAIAAYGIASRDGKPLAPATKWRILRNPVYLSVLTPNKHDSDRQEISANIHA
jgi:hypothetical protein